MLQPKVCLLKRAYVSAKNSSGLRVLWRWTSPWLIFVRATLCEGVIESSLVEKKSHRAAISLQPVKGEGVNAGIFSNPMRFRTKFTATGASDEVFDPCEPSYNHKTLKYEHSNRRAIQWQIQEFSA